MVTEPSDAPVPEKSKKKYWIGFAVLVVIGAILFLFVVPNLYFLTADGPAIDDGFQVTVPTTDGIERVDPTD
jgi:hypothetical protein